MATQDLHRGLSAANPAQPDPIVEAYLQVRATEDRLDAQQASSDLETRLAQFAHEGARNYALAWKPHTDAHASLVALLAAEKLVTLIDGHKLSGKDGTPDYVELDRSALAEIGGLKDALHNLFDYLNKAAVPSLLPLAAQAGLVDEAGRRRDW